jgi:hypothetical protein
MLDLSGQIATSRDSYSLSIDDALTLYVRAGHPRTARSIQRYCASGHLDAIKESTTLGDKYFIDPASVARHIAQIEELIALDNRATGRDLPRPDATAVAPAAAVPSSEMPSATTPDTSGPFATGRDKTDREVILATTTDARYVEHLEAQLEGMKEDRLFLRDQIKTKDEQIASLLERDRETNILVRGLQQMLSPLLGPPRRGTPEPPTQQNFE